MVGYPKFEFSKRDVKRAGDMLAGDLIWTDETAPRIREAFTIANNWRDGPAVLNADESQLQFPSGAEQ